MPSSTRTDSDSPFPAAATVEVVRQVDALCDRFEQACSAGTPDLREYLEQGPPVCRDYLLGELVTIELQYQRDPSGNPLTPQAMCDRYPDLAQRITAAMEERQLELDNENAQKSTVRRDVSPADVSDVVLVSDQESPGLHIRCPHCREPVELLADSPCDEVSCQTCGSTFSLIHPSENSDTAPSLKSLGRFELVARLGVGGFGTVWQARDTDLDRFVALKIPRKGNLQPHEIDHFFREARAAAQLQHPHIVAVYEIGKEEDTIFIVSDLVRGVTLADWLSSAKPTTREIAEIGKTVAQALEHAHGQGVIHRDLKPSNIMIDDQGQPHIMDFGLAKRQTGEVTMTFDGQILGTAAYMSPEQASGQSHWTDCRTDIYSLGVILFQMATGELPYQGNQQMHLYRKQTEDAPDLTRFNPHIPADFSTITLKCLERDPNGRYKRAVEVADELQRFLDGKPIRARPISRLARTWRWAQRKPASATAALLLLLIAVAGPLVAVKLGMQARKIQAKYDEQIDTLAQEQKKRRALTEQNDKLQQNLDELRGRVPGLEKIAPSWQRTIIGQIVDAHYSQPAEALLPGTATLEEQAAFHSAIGFLCAELKRHSSAEQNFELARIALESLLEQRPDDPLYQAALAECLAGIAQHSSQPETVESARIAALDLRERLAESDRANVSKYLDLLVAQWQRFDTEGQAFDLLRAQSQAIGHSGEQLLQQWPTDPAEIYEAACRLTQRHAVLTSD
jgi:ribosomal protein S27E